MKKVTFFLFVLFISVNVSGKNNTNVIYEIRYELSFQPDSNNADLRLKEDMLLWIGLERSMFISYLQYYNDSVFYSLKGLDASIKSERIQQFSKENSRFKFHLFKDFVGKTISDDHYIFGSMYKYSESITDFKWQLHNEYEEYHGFRCQKATTYYGGRHWEVWFAAEIPISDGPYKFAGLPGLILKARDTRSHYVFELVHIRRAEPHKKIYEKDSRPFYVNRCQFLRALQHHNQNIGATVTAGTVNIDPQKVKEIEERFKKRNNHIELKCD